LLERIRYEGINIFQCQGCRGHFAEAHKLESIRRRAEKTIQDLLDEATAEPVNWPNDPVRCPRCRILMGKDELRGIMMDHCAACDAYWLDRAELAAWQFVYETSEAGKEARRFQDRLKNMSEPERHRYEATLQKLKWPRLISPADWFLLARLFR
jgi:Zn-finger nucleic acid-binding protein